MKWLIRWIYALAVAAASGQAMAQTSLTTGAVEVRAFATLSANAVDAATYGGGLFRSNDTGQSWTRAGLPGNARYLTGIAAKPGALFLISAEEGVFRSIDGASYSQVMFDAATSVAIAPGASQIALVGVRGAGVFRSTNGGQTFSLADMSGVDSLDVVALAFHPSDANVAYLAARPDGVGARGGIFRTADGGATWSAYGPGGNNNFVQAVTVLSNGTVYAGVFRPADNSGGVIFRTSGAGSWTDVGNAFGGFVSLHVDRNNATRVWAGGRGFGLLSGTTTLDYAFIQNGSPNLFYTGVNAATTFPGSSVVLKALRGGGVWRSVTGTDPWSRISFPGADRVLSATGMANLPNTMLAGVQAGGVHRSDNLGTTFSPFQSGFVFGGGALGTDPLVSVWSLAASATTTDLVYAATGGIGMFYSGGPTGVFRLSGTTWQAPGEGLPLNNGQPYGVAVNRGNDQTAYAAFLTGAGGIFTRSGGAWTAQNPPGVIASTRSIVTTSNSQKIFALLFDDKAAVSINGGASYTTVTTSQFGFERIRFFSLAENPVNTTQYVAGTNKGLLRSTDGGISWQRVTMAPVFQQGVITAVGFRPATGLAFAADFDGNRYCSNNGGANWVALQPKLLAGVNAISQVGAHLYYLTDGAGLVRETQGC